MRAGFRKSTVYVPSRYISMNFDNDGSLLVHSSRTGGIGVVPPDQAETVRRALLKGSQLEEPASGILKDLVSGGFLVESGIDEAQLVADSYVSRYASPSLEFIVLPTEQCNFRCVYCYEEFKRGEMSREIQNGLREFVRAKEDLRRFSLQWFGGEPLLAAETMVELTGYFDTFCAARTITFHSSATTNGSLLTPQLAPRLVGAGVRAYQITLDGLECDHDKRRVGADGEATFGQIVDNLRFLRDSDLDFTVMLRHNFDPETREKLADYLAFIAGEFAADSRFVTHFEAIGKWGSANDATLNVFEGRDSVHAIAEARRMSHEAGFRDAHLISGLQPDGYVCYAAKPNSYVIGPDGTVYKCTVELDYHDRNIVGKILPDGRMDLDWRKIALWCETDGMEGAKKCTTCWFSPSCHGAICPKEWMEEDDCFCPPAKQTIRETLSLVRDSNMASAPHAKSMSKCPK